MNSCAEIDKWNCLSAEGLQATVEAIRTATNQPLWGTSDTFPEGSQRDVSGMIDNRALDLLLQNSSETDCARLLSCGSQGIASAWLTAVPSPFFGTTFTPACFVTALKLWLGAPLCDADPCPKCPFCTKDMDAKGYHALTCKSHGTLIRRHDNLRNVLFSYCEQGRLLPKKEPLVPTTQRDKRSGMYRDTNTRSDILLQTTGTRPRAIDFAVTSPLQPIYVKGAAKERGFAAERYAVCVKEERYATEFAALGIDFTPLVVETFGAVCVKGKEVLKNVARSVACCRNISVGTVMRRMFAQLSCCLMRYNAHAVLERLPPPPAIV